MRLQPVIEFAYITGWRSGEITGLEWRNVDFKAGEIRFDPGASKNREGRVFPMTSGLRKLLEAQDAERKRLKDAGHIVARVFVRCVRKNRKGKPELRPIGSFKKAWRTACTKAGVPGRLVHDLRRTAIRNLVRAGIPERVAMTMSGHRTRSTFERYNITSGGDLKDAARRLDAVPLQRAQ